jgi:hypothetical protein
MKKLLAAVAAISLTATAAYAAEGMDCCKDCACCNGMKDGKTQPAPAPQPK